MISTEIEDLLRYSHPSLSPQLPGFDTVSNTARWQRGDPKPIIILLGTVPASQTIATNVQPQLPSEEWDIIAVSVRDTAAISTTDRIIVRWNGFNPAVSIPVVNNALALMQDLNENTGVSPETTGGANFLNTTLGPLVTRLKADGTQDLYVSVTIVTSATVGNRNIQIAAIVRKRKVQ